MLSGSRAQVRAFYLYNPIPLHSILTVLVWISSYLAGRTVPIAATRVYEMSFFTGFGVSSLVYFFLNVLFPVPGKHRLFEEVDMSEKLDGSSMNEGDTDSKKDSTEAQVYPT